MDIIELREYCLALPCVTESTPFDETTLVFKVQGKMFCVCDMADYRWISLKCDPGRAVELRERYAEKICPAYHFNKKHWNMADAQSDLSDGLLRSMIRNSFLLAAQGLPRALREEVMRSLGE